ncbi:tetratricopeptide repeat protein [Pseudoxanthomonas broegbernensis]|nr:tetratricopeptide repeat protein [Pseudoxanthomonas broegbernensis]MBB6063999.1 TPR repeat protein [Pseudoxanthomonas broegbernensis]
MPAPFHAGVRPAIPQMRDGDDVPARPCSPASGARQPRCRVEAVRMMIHHRTGKAAALALAVLLALPSWAAAQSFAKADSWEGAERWLTPDQQARYELYLGETEAAKTGGGMTGQGAGDVLYRLALSAYADGEYALAAAVAEQAVRNGKVKEGTKFLGTLYFSDRLGRENRSNAIPWFIRSAGQGDADSMHALGSLYHMALGLDEAAKWYGKAAALGHAESKKALEAMIADGSYKPDTGERDFDNAEMDRKLGSMPKAFAGYLRAAQKGHVQAMYNVGFMYEEGHGIEARPVDAVLWYNRAAGRGHVKAMTKLGLAYVGGGGVGKDVAEGRKWLQRAAAAGDPQAAMSLAVMEGGQ